MTATPGTIPALTQYQAGALPVVGTEAIEIVNTTNATAAASYYMLLTDVVGKMPSALPQANPAAGDYFAFFQVSSGLPKMTPLANFGVPSGNVAAGGTVGQVYTKNSGTNFDASWTTVLPALTITNLTATTGTIATLVTGTATIGTSVVTNLTVTNLTATSATVPTLVAGTATITTSVVTNETVTNLTVTTQTVTTLHATNITASVATAANLFVTTGTATGMAVTNLTAQNATVLGNIIVAGSATLGAPLAVTQGGLATTSLGTVAVLIGGANATAAVSTVPATTAGMVLTSNGSTSAPSWFGSMVLLNTLTPSGVASTTDTTSLTSRYRDYMIMFENVCPATNTTVLQMTVATTGASFVSGGYISTNTIYVNGVAVNDTSTTAILLSGIRATTAVATTTQVGVSGAIFVANPAGTNSMKQFNGNLSYQTTFSTTLGTTSLGSIEMTGMFNSSAAVVGLAFGFSAGNIATGVIKIWGMV